MAADKEKKNPTEVCVVVGKGTKVVHEIIKDAGEVHLHFFISPDGSHEEGEPPVYNINVNVSNSDVNPNFNTKRLDPKEK